ncbi:MAG: permease [Actinobacteria bacterium]|nr:permease [Actinomycetota bacterium]MBU1943960.1 permease [Actinomycetota bacterium]MBU2686952.1 permease [Actinomycetota bacterium]
MSENDTDDDKKARVTDGDSSGQPPSAKPPLRKRIRWDYVFLTLSVVALVTLSLIFPDKGSRAGKVVWEYVKEMIFILPAVMVLMGLFAVWVERDLVVKYLGKGSGGKGLVIALLLGTLPTGPLYVAFPLAAMLLKKGARVANMVVFLSAWACIKLPLELMEFQFMGWRFALLRLGLTVALVIPMGVLAERLYRRREPAVRDFDPAEVKEVEVALGVELPGDVSSG